MNLQKWLDQTNKFPYQNIIQDRINSLYPTFSELKTLYIVNITSGKVLSLEPSPKEDPKRIVPVKLCAICHEEDSVVRHTLRCNHSFHLHCIFKWLRVKNTCPLCRMTILY